MAAYVYQDILTSNKDITLSGSNDVRYCTITFSCELSSDLASSGFIRIDDGDTNTDSSYHTGGDSYETITVSHTVSCDATRLWAVIYMEEPEATDELYFRNAVFSVDYYTRNVSGGCPCCGSFTYDPARPSIQVPID